MIIVVFLFVKICCLMSDHNQANEAEQAVKAGAGNVPGEVREDEDIDGPGHVVWRRNYLISLENKRSG